MIPSRKMRPEPPSFFGSNLIDSSLGLLMVGVIWGITNPFIKRGSSGIENIQPSRPGMKTYDEFKFLMSKWRFMIPFFLNQCGSLMYYISLETADLTMAVTITSSVTFIVTALCGWFLGEEKLQRRTSLGMLLAVCGLMLCFYDKIVN